MLARRRFTLVTAIIGVASVAHAQIARIDPATPAKEDANIGVFVRDSAVAAEKMTLAERMEKAQEWDTSAEVYQEVLDGFADRVVPTHNDAQGRPDRYGGVTNVIQDRIAAWPDAGREVYVGRYGSVAQRLLDAAEPTDRGALSTIVSRYFVTDAARDAALRLVESYFDNGEFVAAATLADRLLDKHPALDATQRPLLLLRSAICWNLAGEAGRAKPRADALATGFAGATAAIGGKTQSLSDVAARELARPRATGADGRLRATDWPMPFGAADHAALAAEPRDGSPGQTTPREWGKLLSFGLKPSGPIATNPAYVQYQSTLRPQRELGAMSGILPAIAGSQLFFQDNTRVFARDLATGEPLPGWQKRYPGEQGAYRIDAFSTPRGAQMGVTLTDRYVLAILGQADDQAMQSGLAGPPQPSAQVTCLDRQTGEVVWVCHMAELKVPSASDAAEPAKAAASPADANDQKQQEQINQLQKMLKQRITQGNVDEIRRLTAEVARRQVQLRGARTPNAGVDDSLHATQPCGSVLAVNDSVYFVTRGGPAGAFDDCYLVCLNLADGRPRWSRHLASGNVARQNLNNGLPAQNAADSHLAYADGRVFVCTDMGAVAAVEAADGGLAWLALYPRPRPDPMRGFRMPDGQNGARVAPAYAGNPVIVRDGKVITLPVDAETLFVHDALTGDEVARVPMGWTIGEDHDFQGAAGEAPVARGDNGGPHPQKEVNAVLVGLSGDTLVVASPRAVSLLDWKRIRENPPGRDVAPRDVLVKYRPMNKSGYDDVPIRGRPFLTDNSIYVPTAWKLFRFDNRLDFLLEQYPQADADDWSVRREESPGNVVAIGGNVVVASSDRVSVYAGLNAVRRRLDATVAADPHAIAPRLRYAEAMFNAGHDDEALAMLDTAIGKAADAAGHAAVFDACAGLLRELARPGRKPDAPLQAGLLQRLADVATTPAQRTSQRLMVAALATRDKNDASAVATYQSILDDAALSAVPLKQADGETVTAGQHAADEIGKLLAATGRGAYEAIEQRAVAELQAARAGGDARAMVAVARRYPNAQAAADAVRAAGEALGRAVAAGGAPREQARQDRALLRQLADRLAEPADRVAVNDALLRSYLAEGNIAAALGRARRIAWIDAAHTLDALPGGVAASTPAALVAELQARLFAAQEAALPDLHANLEGDSFDEAHPVLVRDVGAILLPPDVACSRRDRVLTVARGADHLLAFAPGQSTPLSSIAVDGLDKSAVPIWLANDRVLLRQSDRVVLADVAGGKVAWTFDLAHADSPDPRGDASAEVTIDASGLIASGDGDDDEPATPPLTADERKINELVANGNDPIVARQMVGQQALMQRQLRRQVRLNNAQLNNAQLVQQGDGGDWDADPKPGQVAGGGEAEQANAQPAAKAGETIVAARPVAGGTLIALATDRGRVITLDAATGAIRWQSQVVDRAPAYLGATDDLIVLASTDESRSRVLVLNAADGSEALRRNFSGDGGARVSNIGLSDEGWLVVAQGAALSSYDVLGGGHEPLAEAQVPSATGNPPLRASRDPSQIQIVGGRALVLASSDAGTNAQVVRSFDVRTLEPTRVAGANVGANLPVNVNGNNRQAAERLFAPNFARGQRQGDERITLATHADRLYVMTGQFMTSYPIFEDAKPGSAAAQTWSRTLPDQPSTLSARSPMLVKDGLLIVGWRKEFVGRPAPAVSLEFYSRDAQMLAEETELTRRGKGAGKGGGNVVDAFQPVDGGLYYLTTDGTLTFLAGKK